MTVAEYIAESLAAGGTTDAFGIPGGVVLDLLYALDAAEGIVPHLMGHEQTAGFAACGYAQASGRMGVAYATRGPGFTNLITPMADAFCDSIPVMFITCHSSERLTEGMRVSENQEIDTCSMVKGIVKFSARIDSPEGFEGVFGEACKAAQTGRKGPVFLDIKASVMRAEIGGNDSPISYECNSADDTQQPASEILTELAKARRPVMLIGDGIGRKEGAEHLLAFAEKSALPFVSSRFSHDLLAGHPRYYGYVGSHGTRAANFILSKADLIVAIGNRLNFPPQSASFSAAIRNAQILRCEIDETEFTREIPGIRNILVDASRILEALAKTSRKLPRFDEWLNVCDILREKLSGTDVNVAVERLREVLDSIPQEACVVSDVGNCEFWLSRASVLPGSRHRTLYSKSFGALGCSIGKAIGVHYATGGSVTCIAGDQGLKMNMQELQYIAEHNLPVKIVVVDNRASGMIRDIELRRFGNELHVSGESGYRACDWRRIFPAFGITDFLILEIPEELELSPYLPHGKAMQDLCPEIDKELYDSLDRL